MRRAGDDVYTVEIGERQAEMIMRDHRELGAATAYDFVFDAARGTVRSRRTRLRSIIFDQRRRGR